MSPYPSQRERSESYLVVPYFLPPQWQPGDDGSRMVASFQHSDCSGCVTTLLSAGRSAPEEFPGPGYRSRTPVQAAGPPGLPEPGTAPGPFSTHVPSASLPRLPEVGKQGGGASVLLVGKAQPVRAGAVM